MTLAPDFVLLERALDLLERREVRVLVWGLVDSALSEAEVDDTLSDILNANQDLAADAACTIDTEERFRKRLLDLGYLTEVFGRPLAPVRYRTRMAEGIRLFARLRQLFPRQHEGADWVNGATLVADYRLLWRPRKYPARDLTPSDAYGVIASHVTDPRIIAAIERWLKEGDPNWRFARFQINASARILDGLATRSPRGTFVAAGTGSGKTLAFYLPALAWLSVERKEQPRSRGVRVLALYPRNELLKDQLAEVYCQARKYDHELGRVGATLSVGVLFGDTPFNVAKIAQEWRKTRGCCPFFRCPNCNGELHLQNHLVAEADARLACRSCGTTVDSRQLRFTRKAMMDSPPDILFTSVEMMNQRIADSSMRHLFGVGPRAERTPALMLLDEVHLYTGTFGAQVAHLLRRWSYLTRRQTQFVGLSATISEGAAFFASLVGLDPSVVEEIAPSEDQMVSEGAEYMLALRGDPVSQAALLSTSIQSLMLASRLLDRREQFGMDKRPFAGWRSFAFTDQLDATNRLFYDLRDAEGLTPQGHPATLRAPNGGLAFLRRSDADLRRYDCGQDWRMLENNGHVLTTRHRVERTTSLDAGVSHDAEIVIATAALEVGYDDPAVGVVLQHKAPRDMAQFLQRKGRAGRTRHMRPWTIMVLSDYGRDRLAYQAYEQFFDPELPPRELPLANRYIRRMQATYALIDYLGVDMQAGEPTGSVWRDLAEPTVQSFEYWSGVALNELKALRPNFPLTPELWKSYSSRVLNLAPEKNKWVGKNWLQADIRRRHLVSRLADLLKDPNRTEELARHLSHALVLPREDVDMLLWDHPRPLLLTAIPTALRRLATNWRAHDAPLADRAARHPLPEFIPSTLFSDLALPEVQLLGGRYDDVALPVLQAMSEMAPGKVSRRFDDALWLGPTETELIAELDAGTKARDVDVDPWYQLDPQLSFHRIEDGQVMLCDAWRPRALNLAGTPQSPELRDTSNARLSWRSQLFGRRVGNAFEAPVDRVGIARLVHKVVVHTHASQSAATVRRYAVASNVGLRVKRGGKIVDHHAHWRFTKDGRPCGIGFEIEADALCFVMNLPASPSDALRAADPAIQHAARTARFQWEAQYGPSLVGAADNIFLRNWLAQVFQVAAVTLVQERTCLLDEAITQLMSPVGIEYLENVLVTIFQSPDVPDDDGPINSDREPRLRKKLLASLADIGNRHALAALANRTLTGPIDVSWDDWLRRAQMQTFAAALLDAIQQACPQVDLDDLVVDTDPGAREDGTLRPNPELWISEFNPGGNGLIEQVVEVIATHPDHFYRRIEAALTPSEFELIDLQLREYVQHLGSPSPDADWVVCTQAVRDASSSGEAQAALARLRQFLAERGHAVFHGYVSALSNRLLRPNSPSELDVLLVELLDAWNRLEARVGIEVEARVMCAVFSRNARLDDALARAGFVLPNHQIETWRFSVLLGILWARGHALRTHALPVSERFADTPMVTDRLFLAPWLSKAAEPIDGKASDAFDELHRRLRSLGEAVVSLPPDAALLNRTMEFAATVPVQLEYLNVYPRLTAVVRGQGVIALHFELEATA
ncbi:MAG: protein DpdJ [Oxalobacteraceae bacterium]|nr:protein DpdJ [Oxalobacteraceae bacterium]